MLDKKFWAKYFEVYDTLNEFIPYQELMEDVIEALNVEKGDKILDAGSGTGNLAMRLEKLGANVVALDFSEEGQEIHKRKNPKQTEFVLADLTKPLPFPDNYFDKIVSVNTLYAILENKRGEVIKEFHRIIKKERNGVVVNPLYGLKNSRIIRDHFKKDFRNNGLLKTFKRMFIYLNKVYKIIFFNRKIQKENKFFDKTFFKKEEKIALFKKANFRIISQKNVYSGESLLIIFKK